MSSSVALSFVDEREAQAGRRVQFVGSDVKAGTVGAGLAVYVSRDAGIDPSFPAGASAIGWKPTAVSQKAREAGLR
ncbi:MAG: hypothetical protein IT330_16080 [Anaerolineae bacterium]|nr:hypothetical protein [Anaerolineae bacterium]